MKKEILQTRLPVLGICYGHQLLVYMLGGKVQQAPKREYGISQAAILSKQNIFRGLHDTERIWMSHGDNVIRLPKHCTQIAASPNCRLAAFRHCTRPIFGIQWHPEVTHTTRGNRILKNFIFSVCRCRPNWNPGNLAEKLTAETRLAVNGAKAIVALSGGVDSAVVTTLGAKALGKNLTAVFVDHGFMRAGEAAQVKNIFRNLPVHFISVNAKKRFFKKLKGITSPERKRKIIGKEFIRIFENVAKKSGAEYLLQGTIYPDRIESGVSKKSETIKTHHNVGGLPSRIKFRGIVEPLRDLYKDEVRALGKKLGLPSTIVYRQPFPGPGLAVRIIGEITPRKIALLQKADVIVREEIEKVAIRPWQYFAVLTATKTTGVQGDQRSYGYTIALRAVDSKEAMTANFSKLPYAVLERISTRITNEIPEVTRVVYDITHKPPATIEWE